MCGVELVIDDWHRASESHSTRYIIFYCSPLRCYCMSIRFQMPIEITSIRKWYSSTVLWIWSNLKFDFNSIPIQWAEHHPTIRFVRQDNENHLRRIFLKHLFFGGVATGLINCWKCDVVTLEMLWEEIKETHGHIRTGFGKFSS